MKTYIIIISFFFFLSSLIAQKKEKDTLFFRIDKYYTISPTITPNLNYKTYSDWIEVTKEQMDHTKTNGYISFIGDGYLTKNLKPKKILSIKEYIENRKFYFDGKYNQIIDKWKLKDSLTDKYIIYFVKGDEFIQPRILEYDSYYPRRDKDWNVVQNKVKDTLFFKLDNEYVYQSENISEEYFIKDAIGNERLFFKKIETLKTLRPKKLLNLKEFVQSSRFYNKDKQQKLRDNDLADFLSNYIVFFVNENKREFIHVNSGMVVYD